jgi:hypothetical protein
MSKDTQKPHPRSLAPKFPGIMEQAKALGVSRNHLFKVLTGERKSARLMSAYLKLYKASA